MNGLEGVRLHSGHDQGGKSEDKNDVDVNVVVFIAGIGAVTATSIIGMGVVKSKLV